MFSCEPEKAVGGRIPKQHRTSIKKKSCLGREKPPEPDAKQTQDFYQTHIMVEPEKHARGRIQKERRTLIKQNVIVRQKKTPDAGCQRSTGRNKTHKL